jgi:hypothetical protein
MKTEPSAVSRGGESLGRMEVASCVGMLKVPRRFPGRLSGPAAKSSTVAESAAVLWAVYNHAPISVIPPLCVAVNGDPILLPVELTWLMIVPVGRNGA